MLQYYHLQINGMISRERLVSDLLQFWLLVIEESYHFAVNLPWLIMSLALFSSFSPIIPPSPLSILVSALIKAIKLLDLVAFHTINLVEYHLLLYPALLLFTLLGHQERMEAVRTRLELIKCGGEDVEDIVSQVVMELLENIGESEDVGLKIQDDQNSKTFPACHESGYLSELDLEE